MSSFGPASRRDYDALERQLGTKKAAPMLVQAGSVLREFQDFCSQGKTGMDVPVDNMETVFSIAETLQEADRSPVMLGGMLHCADYIIEQIQLWLWKMYNNAKPLADAGIGRVYAGFLNVLKPYMHRLSVLTTNYDILFEYFAWNAGIRCGYGLDDFLDGANWTHGDPLDFYPCLPLCDSGELFVDCTEDDTAPLVCKLHGSINFFERQVTQTRFQFGLSADVAPVGTMIGQSKIPTQRPSIFALDAIWALRARYGNSITPAIIPPTYAKLRGQGWLRETWGNAFVALQQAKLVLFIGYSMPESDGFMTAMLQAAMACRKKDNLPMVCAVDISADVLKRYASCFRPLDLRSGRHLYEMTFRDAVNEGVFGEILESLSAPIEPN